MRKHLPFQGRRDVQNHGAEMMQFCRVKEVMMVLVVVALLVKVVVVVMVVVLVVVILVVVVVMVMVMVVVVLQNIQNLHCPEPHQQQQSQQNALPYTTNVCGSKRRESVARYSRRRNAQNR